jgi:hypothetical protein
MRRTSLHRALLAALSLLLAGIWLVLPALRRANPTFIAHADPATAAVSGTVVDPDGKPVPFVPILAKGSRWLRNTQDMSVTDADGRFEFVWPWAGEFELTLQPEGAAEQPLGGATCGDIALSTSLPR